MGVFDKVKKLAEEHSEKLEGAVDKAAEVIDEKTGGKYSEQIESGTEKAKGFLEDLGNEGQV
jgi:hypothetical protein